MCSSKLDLVNLSIEELHRAEGIIAEELRERHMRQREEALQRLDAIARELGFSCVLEVFRQSKSSPSDSLYYRDPDNHLNVTTKVGRKPSWFRAALLRGYMEPDLRIENQ